MVSANSHQADVPTAALCTCDSSSDAKLALQSFSGTSNALSCSALPSHFAVILHPAFMVHSGLLCEVSFLSVHENPFCFLLLFIINGTPPPSHQQSEQTELHEKISSSCASEVLHTSLACLCGAKSITHTDGTRHVFAAGLHILAYRVHWMLLLTSAVCSPWTSLVC